MGNAFWAAVGSMNNANYFFMVNGPSGGSSTITEQRYYIGIDGVVSYLTGKYTTAPSTTGSVIASRINSCTVGNLSIAATSGAALYSYVSDVTNSDTLVSSDIYYVTQSASLPGITRRTMIFTGSTVHGTVLGNKSGGTPWSGTNYFVPYNGAGNTTTEALAQSRIRASGTFMRMFAACRSNDRSNNTYILSRINGANGNSSVTISTGVTGIFYDASNTDTLSSSDLVCTRWTSSAGGTGTLVNPSGGVTVASFEEKNDIFMDSVSGATLNSSNGTYYYPIAGGEVTVRSTTENIVSLFHGFEGVCTNIRAYVNTNTLNGTRSLAYRNAGVSGMAVTISSGTTGWFENTTGSGVFYSTSEVSYELSLVTATSGTVSIRNIGLTESPGIPFTWNNTAFHPDRIYPSYDVVAY